MTVLLLLILLLKAFTIVSGSTPAPRQDFSLTSFDEYFVEDFLKIAECFLALNRSSGDHDTVFKYLREGQSLFPATPESTSERFIVPEAKSSDISLCGDESSVSTVRIIRSDSRSSSTVSKSSSSGSDSRSSAVSASIRRRRAFIGPAPAPITTSVFMVQHAPPQVTHFVLVPIVPVVILSTVSVYNHLPVVSLNGKPRLFGLFSTYRNCIIQPEIVRIEHVYHFFTASMDLELRLNQALYFLIPLQFSNPQMISDFALGAPVIETSIPIAMLVVKLLELNAAMQDDRIFHNVLGILLNFHDGLVVTITVIFNNFNDSYNRNQDFFLHSFQCFTA